jgi:hypothetical protein
MQELSTVGKFHGALQEAAPAYQRIAPAARAFVARENFRAAIKPTQRPSGGGTDSLDEANA